MNNSQKLKKENKILKDTLSTYKRELLKTNKFIETLQNQYKRVVEEYRKQFKDLMDNAPKLMALWILRKYRRFRGGERE